MPKWKGDRINCDICSEVNNWFVDGRTIMGYWAIMCPAHFETMGTGLGIGKGQKYDAATLEEKLERQRSSAGTKTPRTRPVI